MKLDLTILATLFVSTMSSSDLPGDWLVESIEIPATVDDQSSSNLVVMANGLSTRSFVTSPNWATTEFSLEASNAVGQGGYRSHVLRSYGPEGYITLDTNYTYAVGGVNIANQNHRMYVNLTCVKDQGLVTWNNSFQYVSHTISKPTAPVPWTPGYRHSPKVPWPPLGVHLEVVFRPPESTPAIHKDISVSVHYELYQGIPLISKWMTVKNNNKNVNVTVSSVIVETLSVNREFAPLGNSYGGQNMGSTSPQGTLYVQPNIPHGVNVAWNLVRQSVSLSFSLSLTHPHPPTHPHPHTKKDSLNSQVNDAGATEPQLNVSYASGPGVHLHDDVTFESFRVMMMLMGVRSFPIAI
jgi:hypothetical protein